MLNLVYKPRVFVDTKGLAEAVWRGYRRKGIGGSDTPVIMNLSPFGTRRDLFNDKTGRIADTEMENWVSLEYGKALEELIGKIFERKTGHKIRRVPQMLQHPLYPFMLADIDFLVETPDGKVGILECKTSNAHSAKLWENDNVPIYYEYQGRHYMSVLNLDFVYFACLFGNTESEFIIRYRERDLDAEEFMINEIRQFWEGYILTDIAPPYTEKAELVLRSLRQLYQSAGSLATPYSLNNKTAQAALSQYLALQAEQRKLNMHLTALKKQMKECSVSLLDQMIGYSTAFCHIDGTEYEISYKSGGKPGIYGDNLSKLKYSYPDIYKQYVSISDSRTFRVSKIKL